MGTCPHSATGRARRAIALAFVALLAIGAAAVPAGAVELGISDSDAPTVVEPHWPALEVTRARVVVPYDLATTAGAAGIERRENFERYRANAAARGVSLLVVFAPSQDVRAPGTGDPIAPSADEFAAGFAAFRTRYPELTTFAAWNEPNNRDADSYALGSQPQLAAEYWLRAQAACPGCLVVAGDFAGIPGDDVYVDAYQAHLAAAGAVPAVWAFHAHSDVNRYQVVGASDARVTRYYLSKLQGPWAGARIWIDEVGARFRDASGLVWGDASQRDATSLLLGLATLDPRIEAIYYYNYSNQCATAGGCAVQDRGLVSPDPFNRVTPDYDALNRRRAAFDVIAAGGPVIAPVEALPPAVVIEQPVQGAALRTPAVAFAGRAATTINTEPSVTLQVFPGAGETESSAPVQTLTVPVVEGRWAAGAAALADGIYTARATQAGNPESTGISPDVVFTVDTVAPAVTVVRGPPESTGSREAVFAFAASEPGAVLVCSVDRGRAVPCSSSLRLARLAVGSHVLGVRARDAAGNVQPVVTRWRWRVVRLAAVLVPRVGSLAEAASGGLSAGAACSGRCRVVGRLYASRVVAERFGLVGRAVRSSDPGRPRVRVRGGWVVVAGDSVVRGRAGVGELRLRVGVGSAGAFSRASGLVLRVGLVLWEPGLLRSRPVAVSRLVTLRRSGALAALGARGLPVTLACSAGCSARTVLWAPASLARALRAPGRAVGAPGLPRGSYVALGSRALTVRAGGGSDGSLTLASRSVRAGIDDRANAAVRIAAVVRGPGTPPRGLSAPLLLPR